MNILIVDDHRIVRDGLKAIMMSNPDYIVVGEATDEPSLRNMLKHKTVDTVILDLKLPGTNGLDLLEFVKTAQPGIRVLMMSGEWSNHSIQKALQSNVNGLMAKESSLYVFLEALEKIRDNKLFIDPALSELAFTTQSNPLKDLSSREVEVLTEFARGLSYKQIADKLFIGPRTVETHKNNILKKLQVDTTYEMIRFAMENKLL